MCLQPFKIKSVNPVSPKLQFVPCGKCKECRNSMKNAWAMRLSLELETCQAKGWHVGFCTLTYNEDCLPHFSVEALDKDCPLYFSKDLSLPACFDRQQVRDFIVNIRRDLDSEFGVHALKYMVCSEYGSHTQRPHYHCIFSWHPDCPPTQFFGLIQKYWRFGFVFPRDFNGGVDSHGYTHQPFIVKGTARFAGAYAGKYCCKDLDFVNSLKGFKFDRKSKEFRNGDCFHIQSRSLGLSYLVGKTDSQLADYLFRGVGFVGDDKLHQLPLYLRNKIFFNPLYIVERRVYLGIRLLSQGSYPKSLSDSELEASGYRVEYKRLVRRECTDFFRNYAREIYDRKVAYWTKFFEDIKRPSYWLERGLDKHPLLSDLNISLDNWAFNFSSSCSGISPDYFASYYVSRFGLPDNLNFDIPDFPLWQMRFCSKLPLGFEPGSHCIGSSEIRFMNDYISLALSSFGLCVSEESEQERLIDFIKDKYKSME